MALGNIEKPRLVVVNDLNQTIDKQIVAEYYPDVSLNKLEIGQSFLELTRKFGKDSNNARAHVLSHELAHIYKGHGFAKKIGTGFASREWNKKMGNYRDSIESMIAEFEADQWSFLFSYMAGYKTNNIAARLLDSIYKYYKLSDSKLIRYPPLKERKKYAEAARIKMSKMCEAYDFANISLLHQDYDFSIALYKLIIAEGFASREVYSNLGTAYLLQGLKIDYSNNFILPLKIEIDSRMREEQTRGEMNDENDLYRKAIEYFEKSKNNDPTYGIAYLNLSMAYWLLDELDESDYNLKKAEKLLSESDLISIQIFDALKKISTDNPDLKSKGIKELKIFADSGSSIAKINLSLINNISEQKVNTLPSLIDKIKSNYKATENFYAAKNIMDSAFFKSGNSLLCYQLELPKGVIARKWRCNYDESQYTLYQYLLNYNENGLFSSDELESLKSYVRSANSTYEFNGRKYFRFDDLILILESDNNIICHLIKYK